MKQNNMRINRMRVRLPGIVGIGALVALAGLGIAYGDDHFGSGTALAGSGDAPTNTTYSQPAVPAATMGATTTAASPWTTVSAAVKVGG